MLLFVILCFVLEYKNAMLNAFSTICDDRFEIYSYKKGLLQIKWQSGMLIFPCTTTDTSFMAKPFDPGRVFQNISSLHLSEVDWSILDNDTPNLTKLLLSDMTHFGDWHDCSRLQSLYVAKKENTTLAIQSDWLVNCTVLRRLQLRDLSMDEIRQILHSALYVQSLYLETVLDLPSVVQYPFFSTIRNTNQHLKSLYVDVKWATILPANLTWSDVSAHVVWQVSSLPLEYLSFYGVWFDLCASGNFSSVTMASLKYLYLGSTNTDRLCFNKYLIMPQLATIEMDYRLRTAPAIKLQVSQLFSTQSPQLLLDLRNYVQVSSFQFTRNDYIALSDMSNKVTKKSNLTLVGFQQLIKCECSGGSWWFARAIRAGLVTAPGVMCEDYRAPEELACEWIDCDRINCNSTCVCCREEHNETSMDCREANLQTLNISLLQEPNLTRLVAPRNNITSLPDHWPDNILWIDLSENNIWHAGGSRVGELFSQPARRVRLAGNYILCSCDNKPLIETLQNKSHQIDDYAGITCAATGTKLGSVDVSQLCASRDHVMALIKNRETILIVVMVTLVVVAASLILAFVLYRRRHEIQIFLFARGWCLSCITEEKLDADRFDDVFVSFCHEDSEFVLTELLPSLDRDYSVCIHLRDWCPGEMIPAQITKSVLQSRRTLVVMSRNFVRSSWGRLEFQTAHVSGLADGRVRVVMIILDDVLEKDQLAPELRSYVRLNTYVCWGDPWFWEKLRYALPHHRSPRPPVVRRGRLQHLQIDCGPRETRDQNIEMLAIEWPEQPE